MTSVPAREAATTPWQSPVVRLIQARISCAKAMISPWSAALDVHPRVAVQILRHSKIAITMEIYTEVPSASTREV